MPPPPPPPPPAPSPEAAPAAAATPSAMKNDTKGAVLGITGTNAATEGTIQVRGKGQPLYVVDGVNMGTYLPSNISPDDIRSVNVVKGQNVAQYGYGDQAKDGIIFIWTKNSAARMEDVLVNDKSAAAATSNPAVATTLNKDEMKFVVDGKELKENETKKFTLTDKNQVTVIGYKNADGGLIDVQTNTDKKKSKK
ncbi:hypothetical protein CK934_10965 [Chitinophaga sp. MD30]|nr:hypothetical protein CK934_10965 [Chitinophaga sp. MD30]